MASGQGQVRRGIGRFVELLRSGFDQEVSRGCTEAAARGETRRNPGRGFLRIVPPQFGQTVRSMPVSLNRSCCQFINCISVEGVGCEGWEG
jgi:hypothetical protein